MNANHPTPTPEEAARRQYRRQRRALRIGQIIMMVGLIVAIVHWLAHIEAFGPGQPEGWLDLVAGYPMGALLLVIGGVIASRKPA